jgi:hypothetical protein
VSLVAREVRSLFLRKDPLRKDPNAHKIEDEVWGAVKAVLLDRGHLKRGLDTYLKAEKDGRPGEGGSGIHEQYR